MSPAEQIKERLNIVEVLSEYLKLEKAGSNYRALCPFHHEKTPSFFVSPSRGLYYCFGCNSSGDIFTFLENFAGLDFRGALKVLAAKAGVTLQDYKDNSRLYSLLELAALFFEVNLKDEAKQYLKGRGLTEETIKSFRIGYAPDTWQGLTDYLLKKGFKKEEILQAGLAKKTPKGLGDHFRGRIMFPILDSAGRVIAFTGRIFPEKEKAPKYLNSPETALFKKGNFLFGFNQAKAEIKNKNSAILVEGQMDLVLLHQASFKNTVALSGTALSEIKGQLKELFFLSPNLILAFDSDAAGRKAALRTAEITLAYGFEVKIANLPSGLDPADLVKQPETLKRIIAEAKPVIEFLTNLILQETPDKQEIGKKVRLFVLPFIRNLPSSIEAAYFVKRVAELTGIREESIWEDLKKLPKKEEKTEEPKKIKSGIETTMRRLLGLFYWQEKEKEPKIDLLQLKKELERLGVFEKDFPKDDLIFEAEAFYQNTNLPKIASELLLNLEEDILGEEFQKCLFELNKIKGQEDLEKKLLLRCQEISQKINEIKTKRLSLT